MTSARLVNCEALRAVVEGEGNSLGTMVVEQATSLEEWKIQIKLQHLCACAVMERLKVKVKQTRRLGVVGSRSV